MSESNWDLVNKVVKVAPTTRRFDGDDKVETDLTLDYSNITLEELFTKAIRSDVISWQAQYRNKSTNTRIPLVDTCIVPKPGRRMSGKAELTAEALASKFGVDKAIEMLMALKAKN